MKALRERQLFVSILIIVAVPLCLRILSMLPLFYDPISRAEVEEAVGRVTEEKGWLLSDMSIAHYDHKLGLYLIHRHHLRGPDCYAYFSVPGGVPLVSSCAK